MSPEPKTVNELPIPTISNVIYSEEFLLIQGTSRQLEFLLAKTKIREQKIEEVEKLTRGQRENSLWQQVRNGAAVSQQVTLTACCQLKG